MFVSMTTPISRQMISSLSLGDKLLIEGKIYTARDAALPLLVKAVEKNQLSSMGIDIEGRIIFHTAVSIAGVGPTTSSKVEIEESIPVLSKAGVRIHIGKGSLSMKTVKALSESNSVFAVTPPVSALLTSLIVNQRIVAFPEEGIEAMHELTVSSFPAVVAIAHGKTIYK